MTPRFELESTLSGTILLDRNSGGVQSISAGLLWEAMWAAAVVRLIDPEAFVEVHSHGVGLAMAQLLRAHDIQVMVSHSFPGHE